MRPAMPAVVALAVTLGLAGCGPPPERVDTVALDDDVVTVASFDFPESELLAEVYGQALQAGGYDVRFEIGLGPLRLDVSDDPLLPIADLEVQETRLGLAGDDGGPHLRPAEPRRQCFEESRQKRIKGLLPGLATPDLLLQPAEIGRHG